MKIVPRLLPGFFLGLSLLLSSCTSSVDPQRVLVTVNGTPIREQQVLEEADRRIDAEAAQVTNAGLIYDPSQRAQTREVIRDDVLHTLMERQLIADQLKLDKIEITDAEIEACFLEKARRLGQTREEAEQEIKRQGKTVEDVKVRLRWHTLAIEKLYAFHATNKMVLTEDFARQIYAAAPAEFFQPEERRVSRIFINASTELPEADRKAGRAKAEQLWQRVKAGEDFAEVARTGSEDGATKARGGDRGWSPRGQVSEPGSDPFGDAAFALKNLGDISDVVETSDGYDIIKLTGIREARQKSFDEVKQFILERERRLEIGNFWEQFAAGMRERAKIEWSRPEAARRAEKEKRDREYNAEIEKQIAGQQEEEKAPAAGTNQSGGSGHGP
jgi:peptidyl-prolyl cis-trans isomerase D